jgi:cephalosporin hydroxylase
VFKAKNKILRSHLQRNSLETIQVGSLNYKYKGISCIKNPFDLALYMLLIHDLKPMTIIEIGSASGGSALWFSDVTKAMDLNTSIYSLDINQLNTSEIDRVTFLQGDIHALELSELPEILKNRRGPLLVVEDGPHTYEGCKSALEFFHPYMNKGDYIVIEDGIVFELGLHEYKDGPSRAINEHVLKYLGLCLVDRNYCDYFGQNFTWATNGYLLYS